MNEDILYKPEEIAQKLKITKGTVYEFIKRGELEAHHIGRHIRISDTQLETYLLKSRGYENIYEADIKQEGDETFAEIGSVRISVNTDLEGQVKVSIRPENIILAEGTFVSSARNIHKGRVIDILYADGSALVVVDIGIPIKALITKNSLNEMGIEKGTEIYVVFKTMSVVIYK
ncbi:MAG: excisionase family DNA-binding protein [Clostridiaceae bacterium]